MAIVLPPRARLLRFSRPRALPLDLQHLPLQPAGLPLLVKGDGMDAHLLGNPTHALAVRRAQTYQSLTSPATAVTFHHTEAPSFLRSST